MPKNTYDVLILGGGPSGLTAAIYTARAHLKTLIIAGAPSGGQLTTTTDVENFPGFENGVQGPELIETIKKQAVRFGSTHIEENVTEISGNSETTFKVKTDSGEEYDGKSIIIATGASPRRLGLESEDKFWGRGVSTCATCDGMFFKGKDIAVIGGGDAAMEEATYLTKYVNKVHILVRGGKEEMRASKIMQDKAFANEKIEFIYNTEVKEVLGDVTVSGLKLLNNKAKSEKDLDVQGMFLAIGHVPNTKFLQGFVDLDEHGHVEAADHTRTSKIGVFVSGDVADFRYRQAITAAGFGCMAALDVEKYVTHGHDKSVRTIN